MSLDFKVVQNYTQALLVNARSSSKEDKLLEQLKFFAALMDSSVMVQEVLCSPVIDRAVKIKLVDAVIKHYNFEETLKGFLYVLVKNSRCNLLPQISSTLDALISASKGIKSAEIISASKLNKKEIQAIQKFLEAEIGQQIILEDKVEESLIGGMVIKYSSNLIDCSIAGALDRIERVALRAKV